MSNSWIKTNGLSVVGLLGVVFVTLKLLHVIDWSWWWVTLPFWGGLVVVGVLFIIVAVLALIAAILSG